MCMLFILQLAQRGCERGLRGDKRLLCTLLCTRPDSSEDRRQLLPAKRRYLPKILSPPRMIVRWFHPARGDLGQ